MLDRVLSLLVFASLGTGVVRRYLMLNRLWLRKHERSVAESISVVALLLSLATSLPFLAKNVLRHDMKGSLNELVLLLSNVAMLVVGIGLFVPDPLRPTMLAKRNLTGLWKRIGAGDFNEDGRPDFLLGNTGLNTRLKARQGEPLTLYFNDFDKNGTPEQILCRYNFGVSLPYTLRNDLVGNLPALRKKYQRYDAYAHQKMTDIFTPEQMTNAIELKAECLGSGVLLSRSTGQYDFVPLPPEAQFAPMFGIAVLDVDGDGHLDALTGGNFLGA